MNYTWFIAKRYLLSKRETTFITVISTISIVGITIGVAALLVVLSVFNGFNSLVTNILVGFDPHVRILLKESFPKEKIQLLEQSIAKYGVAGKSAYVSGKVMILSKKTTKVIYLRGLEPENLSAVSGIKEKLVFGNGELNSNSENNLIIGYALADRLGIDAGDSVFVISSATAKNYLTLMQTPELKKFFITGIYESNNKDYDGLYGFTSISSGQKIYQNPSIQGFDIRLYSINEVEKFKNLLEKQFGNSIVVNTWFDLHKDLYSVMQVERWSAFIILTLIIIVATFNLLGSLTMTVIEKTRDIGILKAMGAKEKDIQNIFRLEGIIIGIIGAALGSILAFVVCWLQVEYHLFPLDESVYIIPALPVEMRISDFVIVSVSTFFLCFIATMYPSKRAAALLPSDAVRWE